MDWFSCAGAGVGILGLAFAAWVFVKMRRLKRETANPNPNADISDYMPAISNPDEENRVKKAISDLLGEKQCLQREKMKIAADRDTAHQKISDLEKAITDERQKRELAERKALSADKTNAELQDMNKNLEESLKVAAAQAQSANETVAKLESKNQKLTEELGDLDDELAEKGKSLKKEKLLTQELESAKSSLEKSLAKANEDNVGLHQANERKAASISFVQDILSAKEEAKFGGLRQKVDELYRYIGFDEDGVAACIKDCGFDEEIDNESLNRWKSITSKPWLNGKKVVAFIGEFSAGKTSIVNAILSDGNPDAILLPVSTKATTAIPTYIAGASDKKANYSFVTPGDICKGINEKTFAGVSKEVLEDIKGVSSLIKYFVMGYDNQKLTGLSILDTPGFSSNDAEDAERTAEVINECDALFWVIDINAGDLNESSKKTLKMVSGSISIPLYVILNKADTKSKEEIETTLEKVRQTFSNAGMSIAEIFPFSARPPQKQDPQQTQEYKVEDLLTRINKVDSSNSGNAQFIDEMIEKLDSLTRDMDKRVHEAQSQNTSDEKDCDTLDSKLGKTVQKLSDTLESIHELPKLRERLFFENKYEMSIDDFKNMEKLIGKAQKCFESIEEVYGQRKDATEKAKDSFGRLKELEAKRRELTACTKKVKTLVAGLADIQKEQRTITADDSVC